MQVGEVGAAVRAGRQGRIHQRTSAPAPRRREAAARPEVLGAFQMASQALTSLARVAVHFSVPMWLVCVLVQIQAGVAALPPPWVQLRVQLRV